MKIKFHNEKLLDIISLYVNGKTIKYIGDTYNISIGIVTKILNENNIKIRNKKLILSLQEEMQICNDYINGLNKNRLKNKYNLCQSSINNILNKHNINNRGNKISKYNVDENFLEKINKKEKAYILGFLYADGCLIKQKSASLILTLELKQTDCDILLKINKIIKNDRPITYRSRKDSRTQKVYSQASLKIISDKIVNNLIDLGMGFRKSFKLTYPMFIDDEFQNHFLRGLFDGDGCIYVKNENNATWNIVGTPEICLGVQAQLNKMNINSRVTDRPYFSGPHASVIIERLENIEKIFNYLYKDADDLFLKRKYDKFLQLNFTQLHIRKQSTDNKTVA